MPPLSKEADAARKREKRGAEARAHEKIALQSKVMPEGKRSNRPKAFEAFEALADEADAALKRDKREKRGAEARAQEKVALQSEARASFVVRSKRIAEASALALALEEKLPR